MISWTVQPSIARQPIHLFGPKHQIVSQPQVTTAWSVHLKLETCSPRRVCPLYTMHTSLITADQSIVHVQCLLDALPFASADMLSYLLLALSQYLECDQHRSHHDPENLYGLARSYCLNLAQETPEARAESPRHSQGKLKKHANAASPL